MAEEGNTGKIEEQIAALKELKEELAQKVRDQGVENPQIVVLQRLLTEYDRCDRELLRLRMALKALKG
jgi:SMC interacting uncharacterized protein involved in chromosome segregation